jgi:hypothetical protein
VASTTRTMKIIKIFIMKITRRFNDGDDLVCV